MRESGLHGLLHPLSSRAIGVKRKSSCSLHLLILAERVAGSRLHVNRETKQTQPHSHAPARRPSHGFRVVAIPPPVVGPPPTRPNPAAFAASYLSL